MLITLELLILFPSFEAPTNLLDRRPGIAIRILGDVTEERVEIARKADHIFISMIKEAGLYDQVSRVNKPTWVQAKPPLLDISSLCWS